MADDNNTTWLDCQNCSLLMQMTGDVNCKITFISTGYYVMSHVICQFVYMHNGRYPTGSRSCGMLRHIAAKTIQHAASGVPLGIGCGVNASLVLNECCIIFHMSSQQNRLYYSNSESNGNNTWWLSQIKQDIGCDHNVFSMNWSTYSTLCTNSLIIKNPGQNEH